MQRPLKLYYDLQNYFVIPKAYARAWIKKCNHAESAKVHPKSAKGIQNSFAISLRCISLRALCVECIQRGLYLAKFVKHLNEMFTDHLSIPSFDMMTLNKVKQLTIFK
jgi:hypothetical protein